jgi:hypothetical protein
MNLNELTKDELIRKIGQQKGVITRLINQNHYKNAHIKHIRLKLRRFKTSIEYLLSHPWGCETRSERK